MNHEIAAKIHHVLAYPVKNAYNIFILLTKTVQS